MTDFSVGDLAQLFLLKRQNASLKTQIGELSTEVTTGMASDMTRHLSGDFAPLASLTASLAQLDGYSSVNVEAGMMAEAMQTALDTIDSQADALASTLLTTGIGGAAVQLDRVGFEAQQSFRTAMSALNTRFGDRSLFAGQITDGPAVADADVVLADLSTLTSGMLTVTEVTDALDAYFADGGSFDTTVYQGGATLADLQISSDETARLDIRAIDPAIKQTLKGLAMGALLTQGTLLGGNGVAQSALAQKAGESLLASRTDRAQLAAHLGIIQARIGDADTRNQAQITALKIAQSQIVSVDQYEAASKLQSAQTQLEALYMITARMAQLSLTDYLR